MAWIKQTARNSGYQGLAAASHRRSISTEMAGLIYPSDNSQDGTGDQGMPGASLPTPRGSTTQTPSTPSKHPTQHPTAEFTRQRANDRAAIKLHIQARIDLTHATFTALSVTDRWDIIRRERKAKLQERETRNRGNAERDFPEEYDEDAEMRWLWKTFARVLEVGLEGGVVGGRRRVIKGKVDYTESSDEEGDADDEELATSFGVKEEEEADDDEDGDVDIDVEMDDGEEKPDMDTQPG